MEIRILKNDDNIFVLELQGNFDLYSSNQVKDLVMKLIEKHIEGIILDLKEVNNIRSAGIGALINISSTLRKLNCGLALANINETVLKTMEVSKLTNYLPITANLKDAVERINMVR